MGPCNNGSKTECKCSKVHGKSYWNEDKKMRMEISFSIRAIWVCNF